MPLRHYPLRTITLKLPDGLAARVRRNAVLNRRDRHHAWAVEQFGRLSPPMLTCEAVLSEGTYMVRGMTGGPEAVLELVARGVVAPTFRLQKEA